MARKFKKSFLKFKKFKRSYKKQVGLTNFLGGTEFNRKIVVSTKIQALLNNGSAQYIYQFAFGGNQNTLDLLTLLNGNADFGNMGNSFEYIKITGIKFELLQCVAPFLLSGAIAGTTFLTLPPLSISLNMVPKNPIFPVTNWNENGDYIIRYQLNETSPKAVSRYYKIPMIQTVDGFVNGGSQGTLGPVWFDQSSLAAAIAAGSHPKLWANLGMQATGTLTANATANLAVDLVSFNVNFYTRWAKRI